MTRKILAVLILMQLACPGNAHAYLDPGVGSMLLQGLAAGVIAVAVFWRGLRTRIRQFFKKDDSQNEDGE